MTALSAEKRAELRAYVDDLTRAAEHEAVLSRADLLALLDMVEAGERDLAAARRTATDRLYMMTAYRHMLGPVGAKVAAMWDEKGVKRQHTDWGPSASELTGEQRAQVHLDVEAAPKRLMLPGEIDAPETTDGVGSHNDGREDSQP